MLPDFNRLKVFYYIFTNNSVVAAAKHLHLTQPAVSQHLQKLEAEIKTPLFTRLHKKLVPTQAGQRLFELVKPFVEQLEGELEMIRHPAFKPSGRLRIGMPYEFAKEYLPSICKSFRQQYPDVTFKFRLDEPTPLMTLLLEGQLDFSVVDYFLSKEQLFGESNIYHIDPLVEEEFILVCSRAYYDEHIGGDHSFKNLSQKEFVTDDPDNFVLTAWFRHHFKKYAVDLNIVMDIDSHQAAMKCIREGMGMGISASHFVFDEVNQGSLVPIKTRKKELINHISLVQLQDKIPTLTEKVFQTYLKKEISQSGVLKNFCKISQIESIA